MLYSYILSTQMPIEKQICRVVTVPVCGHPAVVQHEVLVPRLPPPAHHQQVRRVAEQPLADAGLRRRLAVSVAPEPHNQIFFRRHKYIYCAVTVPRRASPWAVCAPGRCREPAPPAHAGAGRGEARAVTPSPRQTSRHTDLQTDA